VTGVEIDADNVAAAQAFAADLSPAAVRVLQGDAGRTGLPESVV
jgi:hypothetical protein